MHVISTVLTQLSTEQVFFRGQPPVIHFLTPLPSPAPPGFAPLRGADSVARGDGKKEGKGGGDFAPEGRGGAGRPVPGRSVGRARAGGQLPSRENALGPGRAVQAATLVGAAPPGRRVRVPGWLIRGRHALHSRIEGQNWQKLARQRHPG